MKEYTPYTYLIGWSTLNKFYYGSRTAKKHVVLYETGCHPDDLFVTYTTSSKIVKNIIKTHGNPDIIQVRKTFKTASECLIWENKVLSRLDVLNNEKFLNQDRYQELQKVLHCKVPTINIYCEETDIQMKHNKNLEIPPGFKRGARPKTESEKKKYQNRKWFHHKITGVAIHTDKIPDNLYLPGRGSNYKSNSDTLKNRKMIWINDGINNILINKFEKFPIGYKKGLKFKNKPSGKRKNKYVWITDGLNNKWI